MSRTATASFILALLIAAQTIPAFGQSTYRVCTKGKKDFTTIQDCIDGAVAGDTCEVCKGTWTEDIFIDKEITVRSEQGPANTTIDVTGIDPNAVEFYGNLGSNTVLDGFTVTGATGSGVSVFNAADTAPTVSNCIITGNGYGIHAYIPSPGITITNCTVDSNEWGIYGTVSTLSGSTITNNRRYGLNSTIATTTSISNCTFSGNGTDMYGDAAILSHAATTIISDSFIIDNDGPGVILQNLGGSVTNTTIARNGGDGINFATWNSLATNELTDVDVLDNQGSGVVLGGGQNVLTGCNILRNDTAGNGGGIKGDAVLSVPIEFHLSDVRIQGNSAAGSGGGIDIRNNGTPGTSTITNSIIAGNSADAVGAIYDISVPSNIDIVNSTVSGNTGLTSCCAIFIEQPATLNMANSIVWGNAEGGCPEPEQICASSPIVTYSDVMGGYPGIGNIGSDLELHNPIFKDLSDPDPANWDLGIQEGSPCIDAGDPASAPPDFPEYDIDGDPRTLALGGDGLYDMGADEDVAGCTVTESPEATCSDGVDNDCDGLADCLDTADCGGDPVCQTDCTQYGDQATCTADPDCRWRKKQQDCINR